MRPSTRFVQITQLSRTIGLPAAWIRREADAGRLPCIRAGRLRMFDTEAVLRVLAERQSKGIK
jgi:hypothetical protein